MPIWPLLFWSIILLSVLLLGAGIRRTRTGLVVAGTVAALPLLAYLGATPLFRQGAWLMGALLAGAVWAVHRRQHRGLALLLALPYWVTVAWLAYTVITQDPSPAVPVIGTVW
jgi:hypothetical protein